MSESIIDAITNDDIETVNLLLSDPMTDPTDINEAMDFVSEFGIVHIMKLLLSDSRIDSKHVNDALLKVAYLSKIDAFKLLIGDSRIDSDHINTAIAHMLPSRGKASARHIEMLKILLADPRVDSKYINKAIAIAYKNNDENLIKILSADPRADNRLLAIGGEGCIYRPAIKCKNSKSIYGRDTVGKVSVYSTISKEYDSHIEIDKIDPYYTFHLYVKERCDVEVPDTCYIPRANKQIVYEYGGKDISSYLKKHI